MTFKTVSFQGTQLSAGQRRTLAFQQSMRTPFLNPVIQASVDQVLAVTLESISAVYGVGFAITLTFYFAGMQLGFALSLIRKL